jgi:predicted RNA-binding protein with RPS1 domain
MLIHVKPGADQEKLQKIIANCSAGDTINVTSAEQFEDLKKLLVLAKKIDIRLVMIDDEGYASRQIQTKKRSESTRTAISGETLVEQQSGFNDRQMSVIRALERVMTHCKKEGISLVGYSDELVAIPAHNTHQFESTVDSYDLDTQGVYTGADNTP